MDVFYCVLLTYKLYFIYKVLVWHIQRLGWKCYPINVSYQNTLIWFPVSMHFMQIAIYYVRIPWMHSIIQSRKHSLSQSMWNRTFLEHLSTFVNKDTYSTSFPARGTILSPFHCELCQKCIGGTPKGVNKKSRKSEFSSLVLTDSKDFHTCITSLYTELISYKITY